MPLPPPLPPEPPPSGVPSSRSLSSSPTPSSVTSDGIAVPVFQRPLEDDHGHFVAGLRHHVTVASCVIWGTLGFLWLLALRPPEWSNVFLIGSGPTFWSPSILTEWTGRLVIVDNWSSLPPDALTSAAIGFVGEDSPSSLKASIAAAPFLGPLLGLVEAHPASRRRHFARTRIPDAQWLAIHHSDVSGVTTFTGFFLTRSLPMLTLDGGVPMTLGAILDHKVYLPPAPEDPSLLSGSDRLPFAAPLSRVLLPSRFSPTGFGARSLTARELLLAWDFPLWTPTPVSRPQAANILGRFPPLRILLQLSDAALRVLSSSLSPITGLPLPALAAPSAPSSKSWLPRLSRWLPHDWIDASLLTPKAAKADGAVVPVHLWDRRISLLFPCSSSTLDCLRRFFFSCACRWVFRSLRLYLRSTHGLLWHSYCHHRQSGGVLFSGSSGSGSVSGPAALACPALREAAPLDASTSNFSKDVVVARIALRHFTGSSWWKWDKGSAPLFWRWPTAQSREAAQDGFEFFIKTELLPSFQSKTLSLKEDTARCLTDKVGDLLVKGYIDRAPSVRSQIDYFAVPKVVGPDGEVLDVRLVFNGTSCGLNGALWAPSFWLPTPDTALRKLQPTSLMVDFDLGEFFLNFFLPYNVRDRAGVNLLSIHRELKRDLNFKVDGHYSWRRLLFGLGPSPYNSIRFYYHAEEFVLGDPRESGSPLRWDSVILNLPGQETFDPRFPWVYQWDAERKCIAGSIVTFVDDGRGSGSSVEHSWQLLHRASTRFQHLGIQVATRKTRPPAPGVTPGAWAGMIAEVDSSGVYKTVAQAKWDKAKAILTRIKEELSSSESLSFKPLERDRGFLVHLATTFKSITPYLKGIHLTLDSWRANRKQDGWKMSPKEWGIFLEGIEDEELREGLADLGNATAPSAVFPVPRLHDDIQALTNLFSSPTPTRVCVRPTRFVQVVLGFGDASGNGFGGTFLSTAGLSYQIGVWKYRGKSSCSFEFRNLLDALNREGEAGRLRDSFVLMMTDNQPVEEALYKGTSASRDLLAMVQEFHSLEMKFGFVALVCHCAGTRMISQGTDGLSRGGLNEGVMGGKPMTAFIPLHLSAFQRTPLLEPWVRSWAGKQAVFLTPDDWFLRGHDIVGGDHVAASPSSGTVAFWRPIVEAGVLVWSPPPAAANVALEELRKARIKRQTSTHIFLVPRLCTPSWLKQLFKAADLILEIPPGSPYWPSDIFDPWSLRFAPKVLRIKRELQKMWKTSPLDTGGLLFEFVALSRRFPTMPRRVVRRTNDREVHQLVGDNPGDNLWGPKAPDLRQFDEAREGGDPDPDRESHQALVKTIMRANLDVLWSRTRSTVKTNRNTVARAISSLERLGLGGPFYDPGPTPFSDFCGFETALAVLLDSQRSGKYAVSHKQWDSIRKVKSAVASFEKLSNNNPLSQLALLESERGYVRRFHFGQTASLWYQRFAAGCKARMGQDVRPNQALKTELWLQLLELCRNKARLSRSEEEGDGWIMAGAYLAFAYVLSLRGPEGFMFEISLLVDHRDRRNGLVWLPIVGKVKGADSVNTYFLRSVPVTSSGINVEHWRDLLLAVHHRAGRQQGPAFCDPQGFLLPTRRMNQYLWEALEELFVSEETADLFPKAITSPEDIQSLIEVDRSPRRSSDSRATAQRVSREDKDVVNRWSQRERAKGAAPIEKMSIHYADQELLDDCFRRYTMAM
eukprot:scaffold5977_cov98-Cylindrotheca_fusiformis.AAC.1